MTCKTGEGINTLVPIGASRVAGVYPSIYIVPSCKGHRPCRAYDQHQQATGCTETVLELALPIGKGKKGTIPELCNAEVLAYKLQPTRASNPRRSNKIRHLKDHFLVLPPPRPLAPCRSRLVICSNVSGISFSRLMK